MTRVPALLAIALAAVVALFAPARAWAQVEPPRVEASADPTELESGESFTVQLRATADASGPSVADPQLRLPTGLAIVAGPSVGTQTQISIVNGRITRSSGISATWRVATTQPGTFTIPGPSVAWNGRRVAAAPLRVAVLPSGSRPRTRPAPPGAAPWDPFGALGQMPGWFDQPHPAEPQQGTDSSLALEVAPDPNIFLRAVPDKTSAVVGEQVGLTVYVYSRRGAIELTDMHEPAAPKFFRRDLSPPVQGSDARLTTVAGQIWRVQPIFQVALFPLEAGALEIGPMSVTAVGGGLRGRGQRGGVPIATQPVRVQVGEPPLAGRPRGYQIGDVGRYTLSASVDPRTTEVGGAVAVRIDLSGTGNVPSTVRVPENPKLEWLEPQTRESFEVQRGVVRGSRTFTYVVRPKAAGTIELGAVRLPYWDPERRTYDVAEAALGTITVAPGAAPAASAEPPKERDPFAHLAPARTSLGPVPAPARPWSDRPPFWLALFGAPLAVASAQVGAGALRRARARRAAAGEGPAAALARALAELAAAEKGDPRGVLAALEKALYLAIEAHAGVRARGLLRAELAPALAASGVSAELAARVAAALDALEATRFTPTGEAPAGLADEVRAAIDALRRRR